MLGLQRQSAALALVLLALFSTACKPKAESQLKNLDAFTRGVAEADLCSGPADADSDAVIRAILGAGPTYSRDLRTQLTSSMRAVPLPLLSLFKDLGGVVLVTSAADRECRQALLRAPAAAGTSVIASCFIYKPAAGNKPRRLAIVVDVDREATRGAMVKQFGYLFAQLFAKVRISRGASGEWTVRHEKTGAGPYSDDFVAITNSYLTDVHESGRYSLQVLQSLLGEDGPEVVTRNIEARNTDLLDGLTFGAASEHREARAEQFRSYVVAESFNDYFCNLRPGHSTRERLHRLFPKTFERFKTFTAKAFAKKVGGMALADEADCTAEAAEEEPIPDAVDDGSVAADPAFGLDPFEGAFDTSGLPATEPYQDSWAQDSWDQDPAFALSNPFAEAAKKCLPRTQGPGGKAANAAADGAGAVKIAAKAAKAGGPVAEVVTDAAKAKSVERILGKDNSADDVAAELASLKKKAPDAPGTPAGGATMHATPPKEIGWDDVIQDGKGLDDPRFVQSEKGLRPSIPIDTSPASKAIGDTAIGAKTPEDIRKALEKNVADLSPAQADTLAKELFNRVQEVKRAKEAGGTFVLGSTSSAEWKAINNAPFDPKNPSLRVDEDWSRIASFGKDGKGAADYLRGVNGPVLHAVADAGLDVRIADGSQLFKEGRTLISSRVMAEEINTLRQLGYKPYRQPNGDVVMKKAK